MGRLKIMSTSSNFSLETSLQVYFFDILQNFNKKSTSPLPNEMIFYMSLVMDKFGMTHQYFEKIDGKYKEKILGLKLLETTQLSKEKQKENFQDIGETALHLCGYFPESLNKKIVDSKYYQDIGVQAYIRLNSLSPKAYNMNNFYQQFAHNFARATAILSFVSEQHISDPSSFFLVIPNKKYA